MKKTSVYLVLLISLLMISTLTLSNTNAQTSNIKVLDNYNWYYDSVGFLIVIAEIQNTGPNTIDSVMVGGTLTLSDGTQSEATAQVWGYNIVPQQKAPVYLEFSPPDSFGWNDRTFESVDFTILSAEPTSDYFYADMTLTSDQGIVTHDGVFWIEGSLKNTGSKDANEIYIIATFFTEQGQLAGVGRTNPLTPNPLTPAQTTNFKVGAYDLNQTEVPEDLKIASYSMLIQVTGTVLQGAPPVIVATPTPGPISTATKNPENNPPQNIDPSITYIALIIIIALVVVAGVILIKKIKTTKPQPAKPTKKQNPKNNPQSLRLSKN